MRLGCIADDFTGASDAASFLAKGGLKTLLFSGIPKGEEEVGDWDAAVIALKTRTERRDLAVAESLEAARWLKEQGAGQLYVKYCSTFDSTPEGNIGPVLDGILEEFQVPYTILCPALPVNGRIVRDGNLYVNGQPLHESPMKDHPLTPMWDSDLAILMEAQSRYTCLKIRGRELADGEAVRQRISAFARGREHFYVIPDYCDEEDARRIVKIFGTLPVLSGGSGILQELGERMAGGKAENMIGLGNGEGRADGAEAEEAGDGPAEESAPAKQALSSAGSALILAGSCSKATRGQIAWAISHGIPAVKMDYRKLTTGEQSEEEIWAFIQNHSQALVYSSESPEEMGEIREKDRGWISDLLEETTARLAKRAVEAGFRRIVGAGGETSGAVTKALGYDSYEIGESVAPGVPVMIPRKDRSMRLVLKSGNFGQADFFERALEMTNL